MATRSRGSQQWGGSHEFIITRVENGGRGGARASSRMQGVLQNWCRNWKNYTVAFITLAAMLWFIQGSSSRRAGSEKGGRKGLFPWGQADTCPVHYPRLTVEEIRGGRYPYLYGGSPQGCKQCRSEDHVAKFCQFGMDGHGQCWGGRRERLVQYYLQRGFTDILTFTPCDMWPLLRGRTLFFSGDSQTQDFMMAAHCFMYEFTDLGWRELTDEGVASERRPGFVWHTGPGCVLLPDNTRICFLRCDTVKCMVGEVLQKVARVGKRRDFLVLNFGLHFSETYREELQGLVSQVQQLQQAGEFPHLIWKDTPPQHFQTTFGEYPEDKPKPPFECAPIGRASPPQPGADKWRLREDHSVEVVFPEFATIAEGGWRNKIANEVMAAAGVSVVAAWNETLPLWDYHRDNGAGLECTHFCVPSAPQLWVYLLAQTLRGIADAEPAGTA